MVKIKEFLKKLTLENCVLRLIYSWFTVCSIAILANLESITDKKNTFFETSYFKNTSFILFIFLILALFATVTVLFTLMESKKTEKLILLISYFVYAFICLLQYNDNWFALGAVLVLFAVCKYVFSDDESSPLTFNLPKHFTVALCVGCALIFALFVGIQTSFRVLTQSTPCFDFGIFSQMFYNMKESLLPYTTCERNFLLSHFSIHVSPIYYLFLPIYAIFPDPITLEICQAALLASGVIPIYLLCKKIGLSNKATVVFSVLYTFYPALAGGCYYDLHENKFLAPLLLWLFYFIEKNKWWGCILFSSLVLLVKEDAPVYIVFISLFMLLSKKDYKKALVMLGVSLLYFLGVLTYLENQGQGVMSYRYDNFIYDDGGLFTVIKAIILSPAKVIKEIFENTAVGSHETPKIEFILQTLVPLGFLPLITKKYSRYILLCPYILVNLMPDYVYQHSVSFQYTYASMAFLMYASILNYKDFTPQTKRTTGAFACICAILLSAQITLDRPNYVRNYIQNQEAHSAVRQALLSIPEKASVKSSTFYLTTLSQREILYCNDNYETEEHTEYIVLDLRYNKNNTEYNKLSADSAWETVEYIDSWLAILRCTECQVQKGHS